VGDAVDTPIVPAGVVAGDETGVRRSARGGVADDTAGADDTVWVDDTASAVDTA
jgi:hypothetical protein